MSRWSHGLYPTDILDAASNHVESMEKRGKQDQMRKQTKRLEGWSQNRLPLKKKGGKGMGTSVLISPSSLTTTKFQRSGRGLGEGGGELET